MTLFALLGVLRGFPGCGVQTYASPKTHACPAIALFRATADAALRPRQGFAATRDQDKNCSFLTGSLPANSGHC